MKEGCIEEVNKAVAHIALILDIARKIKEIVRIFKVIIDFL
jgi:hypothetical protein